MKRIYLSGPMSGIAEFNFPTFNAEAARLRAAGFEVVNPVDINADPAKSWHDCLRADLAAMLDCDTIALLHGWEGSAGAQLEVHLAHRIGMKIVMAADLPKRSTFDLVAHIRRAKAFSERTFGPGARTAGVVAHIRKELVEIEAAPADLSEWIDVVILALDGAWRAGYSAEHIVEALAAKQAKNEARKWPDWRTAPADGPIEHVRDEARG